MVFRCETIGGGSSVSPRRSHSSLSILSLGHPLPKGVFYSSPGRRSAAKIGCAVNANAASRFGRLRWVRRIAVHWPLAEALDQKAARAGPKTRVEAEEKISENP